MKFLYYINWMLYVIYLFSKRYDVLHDKWLYLCVFVILCFVEILSFFCKAIPRTQEIVCNPLYLIVLNLIYFFEIIIN